MMEEMNRPRSENMVAGLVGAFLGSLLGVVCIVVVGQMGYIAALSGLLMAVCALKGYEKFAGGLSKKGIIACCVLMLVMTYLGNRMDWAFSASKALDMGLMDSYRAIPLFLKEGVIESAAYWGNLVMLYLFTVLGAVPTVRNALLGPSPLIGVAPEDAEQIQVESGDLTLYTANPKWIKPFFWLVFFYTLVPLIGIFVLSATADTAYFAGFMLLGLLAMLVLMILGLCSLSPFSQARAIVFAQWNGTLWRVDPRTLNIQPGYTFAPKRGGQLFWDKLHPEEQESARRAILLALHAQESMDEASAKRQRQFLMPLREMQLIKSTPRFWVVRYEALGGGSKKLRIPKVYPDLPIEPGAAPLEKGPRPNILLAVAVLLFSVLPVVGLFLPKEEEVDPYFPSSVHTPGSSTYENGPLTYELSSRMQQEEPGVYVDPDWESYYFVTPTLISATPQDLRPFLEQQLSELKNLYTENTSMFSNPPDRLTKVSGPNGQTYEYDCCYFEADDGTMVLSYAVYLPQVSAMLQIDVVFDQDSPENVSKNVFDLLSTLEVDENAPLLDLSDFELTEENYQSFFAPASDLGYEHMGRAYIKFPEGMYDEGSFSDVYLPYSTDAVYNEEGTMITSKAHGIQLSVTLVQNDGNASDVAKQLAQQVYDAKGQPLNGELLYDEELDVALWVSAHSESGMPAPQIFYADIKQPGYYLAAVITYLPNELDDLSDEMVEEVSSAYSLTLPPLDISHETQAM